MGGDFKTVGGIDPGLDGGFAEITGGAPSKCLMGGMVQTKTVRTSSRKNKRVYDTQWMHQTVEMFRSHGTTVFIENVHAFPGQGVTSMFSMGYGFGLWVGMLTAHSVPFHRVEPATWKRQMGLSRDKEQSRLSAIRMFPEMTENLRLKKSEGAAEAMLLAEYGRRLTALSEAKP